MYTYTFFVTLFSDTLLYLVLYGFELLLKDKNVKFNLEIFFCIYYTKKKNHKNSCILLKVKKVLFSSFFFLIYKSKSTDK